MIEDNHWIGLKITDNSVTETFLFTKSEGKQKQYKVPGLDVLSSSTCVYIKDDNGKFLDSFHANGELFYCGIKIENSECKSLL